MSGKRGAEIIEARGASSAASAANAAIDHMRDWTLGSDGLRSMAVPSDGSYGVDEGTHLELPGARHRRRRVRDRAGPRAVGDFAQSKIDATVNELKEEREAVKGLGLV